MTDSQQPKKKQKPFNQNAAIRGAIRRIFSRSPVKRDVLMAVRRERPKFNQDGSRSKKDAVEYMCNLCKQYVGSTKVEVDHLEPVIEINEVGFVDWNTFVTRLFCTVEKLQVLCDPCHDKKTHDEQQKRQMLKDKIALDEIEQQINYARSIKDEQLLKKTLTKYLSKKKALETRERALRLKARIIERLTKED
jgi:5-methylcytosine-specific restriction endonuclease McrA